MAPAAIRRKLVIVGDGACGKTSLLCVFAMGEFPKEYHPTIFENYVAEIRLDGKPVQLALWDTAGQEEYERLRPLSYSKSHIILIAFSIDTPDSLENCTVKWADEVRSICGSNIPVMLVGCKKDLRDEAEATGQPLDERNWVTRERGQQVCNEIGARCYRECSSLRNEGVDEIFEAATRQAMLVRNPAAHGVSSSMGGSVHGQEKPRDRRKSSLDPAGKTTTKENKGCCVIL